MKILRRIGLAISYITCIPALPISAGESKKAELADLEGLAKYLPSVGLLLGLLLLGLAFLIGLVHTTHILNGTILTLAWLLLTNGLHFDGLMDTADGIFSHQSKERILEIMQDPRVGNFGVLTGLSVLLLKVAALASLSPPHLLLALFFIPAWSRWAETFAIGAYPYLKPQGKGKVWHDSTKHPHDLLLAGLPPAAAVAAALALGYWQAALVSLFTVAAGLSAAAWLARKLDGHTGDTYGSVVELAEAGGLLGSALVLPLLSPILPR